MQGFFLLRHENLPQAMLGSFRRSARLLIDRAFWRNVDDVQLLGGEANWWVCTRLLRPGSFILSGGAGKDVSFEIDLARLGCNVALFDPSPTGKTTMERAINQHPGLRFFSDGLAARDTIVRFAPPAISDEGSFRVATGESPATVEFQCVSPKKALEMAGFADCALCKLDIEGFEYEVLTALLADGFRPAQIAVEFHHFMPDITWRQTFDSVCELQRAGYRIVRKRQTDYLFIREEFL